MIDHTRTKKIGGDSIFIFVVIQVERETVMTRKIIYGEMKGNGGRKMNGKER